MEIFIFEKRVFNQKIDVGSIKFWSIQNLILEYEINSDFDSKELAILNSKKEFVNLNFYLKYFHFSVATKKTTKMLINSSEKRHEVPDNYDLNTIITYSRQLKKGLDLNSRDEDFSVEHMSYVIFIYLLCERDPELFISDKIISEFDKILNIKSFKSSRSVNSFLKKIRNIHFWDTQGKLLFGSKNHSQPGGQVVLENGKIINNWSSFSKLDSSQKKRISDRRIREILLENPLLINILNSNVQFKKINNGQEEHGR